MFFVGYKTDRLLQIMKKHLAFLADEENENRIKKLRTNMGLNEIVAVCKKDINTCKKTSTRQKLFGGREGGGA